MAVDMRHYTFVYAVFTAPPIDDGGKQSVKLTGNVMFEGHGDPPPAVQVYIDTCRAAGCEVLLKKVTEE